MGADILVHTDPDQIQKLHGKREGLFSILHFENNNFTRPKLALFVKVRFVIGVLILPIQTAPTVDKNLRIQ